MRTSGCLSPHVSGYGALGLSRVRVAARHCPDDRHDLGARGDQDSSDARKMFIGIGIGMALGCRTTAHRHGCLCPGQP
jgi:hypothetical protein